VLAAFRDVPNVLLYLGLPLQHSHPEILQAMNRPWQKDVTRAVLDRIRDQPTGAVLRTTLIVSFPGERGHHFRHLQDLLRQQHFDHVGVFAFSPEEGSASAAMGVQVPSAIAEQRRGGRRSRAPPALDRWPEGPSRQHGAGVNHGR